MTRTTKWRVRCVETYTVTIPADQMIDARTGRVLCEVPARSFTYLAGQQSGFSNKKRRDEFLKANAGKWEAV